jgi:hypothetical protein
MSAALAVQALPMVGTPHVDPNIDHQLRVTECFKRLPSHLLRTPRLWRWRRRDGACEFTCPKGESLWKPENTGVERTVLKFGICGPINHGGLLRHCRRPLRIIKLGFCAASNFKATFLYISIARRFERCGIAASLEVSGNKLLEDLDISRVSAPVLARNVSGRDFLRVQQNSLPLRSEYKASLTNLS